MLVLLPPSETKSDGGNGAPLDLGELSMPQLTDTREMLVQALVDLAADSEASMRALGLGATQADEIERNAKLWVSATRPALERYTGVLFDALDVPSFTRVQREKAYRRLAMGSALFGAVRAGDPIPAYRLSGGSKLPGFGTLQALWKPELTDALVAEAAGDLVVDLRSGVYQQLGPVPGAVTANVRRALAFAGSATPSHEVYLCHNYCELGATKAVIAEAATWPWVRRGESGISVEGARALLLGPECGSGPTEAFMIGREFCHGHAGGDFSLHATLPEPLAEAAVDAGWAELHFFAAAGKAPRTVVLIYAPRDDHERDVVLRLVRASYEFALGQPNPCALPLMATDS